MRTAVVESHKWGTCCLFLVIIGMQKDNCDCPYGIGYSNESLAYVHFIKFMLQALATVTLIVN